VGHYDTVIFPDAGAATRYNIKHSNIAIGSKVRDQDTGWITHYELEGKVWGNVIVVDDLCDGGKTFELLAQSIFDPTRNYPNIERLDLSITHGIFSKGLDKLMRWYNTIFTTNSFFGHTVQSGPYMVDNLGRAAMSDDPRCAWYANLWKYTQQQRLVVEGV